MEESRAPQAGNEPLFTQNLNTAKINVWDSKYCVLSLNKAYAKVRITEKSTIGTINYGTNRVKPNVTCNRCRKPLSTPDVVIGSNG
jgi:hypothetical protein